MAHLRFTAAARRDLGEIVHYIAQRDASAATRLLDRLETQCRRLSVNPGIGQARPDLAPGVRFIPVGNYLIFYREHRDDLQILRILHGARDYRPGDF